MRKLVLVASFAVALLVGVGHALAATVNIAFTGTTTVAGSGYNVGDAVSGGIVMTMPDAPTFVDIQPTNFYLRYEGTGTLTLGALTVPGFPIIENIGTPGPGGGFGGLRFTLGSFELLFESFGGQPAPLLSLINFPDKASVFTYLAGSMVANERGGLNGFGFHIDTFSLSLGSAGTVPIPAALPLLASALGGLGLLGWRRRRLAAAA